MPNAMGWNLFSEYFATGKQLLAKNSWPQVLSRIGFAGVLCQIATFSTSSEMKNEQPIAQSSFLATFADLGAWVYFARRRQVARFA
jgi:hypothetical protein